MRFKDGNMFIGTGTLKQAVQSSAGVDFYIDTEGAIVCRGIADGRRGVTSRKIVSYAEAYAETDHYTISVFGGETEIVKKEMQLEK